MSLTDFRLCSDLLASTKVRRFSVDVDLGQDVLLWCFAHRESLWITVSWPECLNCDTQNQDVTMTVAWAQSGCKQECKPASHTINTPMGSSENGFWKASKYHHQYHGWLKAKALLFMTWEWGSTKCLFPDMLYPINLSKWGGVVLQHSSIINYIYIRSQLMYWYRWNFEVINAEKDAWSAL